MRVSFNYTKYSNSTGATVLCAVGGFLKSVGFPLILLFGMGLVFIAMGFGMQKLGEVIGENKNFKLWMKSLRDKGILEQIPNNTELALKLYEANQSKKTLKYLQTANPQAALIIAQNKQNVKNKTVPTHVQAENAPEPHNINREHYEQLYLQSGLKLMQERESAERAFDSIIANTEQIEQQNDDCLLMIYAYLRSNQSSIDVKSSIIKTEYVYRILRSRNCEGYKMCSQSPFAEQWKNQW